MNPPLPTYHANQFTVSRGLTGILLVLGTEQTVPDERGQLMVSTGWFGTLSIPAITAKALHKALGEQISAYEAQWGKVPDASLSGSDPDPDKQNVITLGDRT